MARYESLALKLVPKNHDRSRSALRVDIAKAIESEVDKALTKQLTDKFPELAPLQKQLELMKVNVADLESAVRRREDAVTAKEKRVDEIVQAAMSEERKAVENRESNVKRREIFASDLVIAVHEYVAWMNGDGEIDENGKRFKAVQTACENYVIKEKRQ